MAKLTVALITDVFPEPDDVARLRDYLTAAKSEGAELAVLPELPLNPWSPATKDADDADAEMPGGPRATRLSAAAADIGIAIVGGAIVIDPDDGQRRNTALVFDAAGELIATYAKCHLPEEPGFWETSHYLPGIEPPQRIDFPSISFGLQICSDINRPVGSQLLAAQRVGAIIVPRATEARTYPRWQTVFRATALTCSCYVLSVNRPARDGGPEHQAGIGGQSVVVAPDGEIVVDATDPMITVSLDQAVVDEHRRRYPGYLPLRRDLYAAGWQAMIDT